MAKGIKTNKVFIVFSLIVLVSWWGFIKLMDHRMIEMEDEKLNTEVELVASEIKGLFDGEIMVFDMIANYVAENLDSGYSQFDHFGRTNGIEEKGFVNFSVAPEGVIDYVYPRVGNEMVIGTDLLSDSRDQVSQDINISLQTGERVVTGPVPLIRGGTGMIFRQPIFVDGNFWGLVSAVIDLEQAESVIETFNESDIYTFAVLSGSEIIAGDEGILGMDEQATVSILNDGDIILIGAYSPEINSHNKSVMGLFKYSSLILLFLILAGFYWTLQLNSRLGKKLKKIVYYDTLTSLPNRRSLHEEITSMMKEEKHFYLAFIDLDDFKNINDTLGHTFGDRVLEVAAQRFVRPDHKKIRAYRWGGDEFVLTFCDMDKSRVIAEIEEIIKVFGKPIEIEQSEFTLSLSIGIVSFPLDSDEEDDLIKKADMLMYTIKHSSKNAYRFYEKELEAEIVDKIHLSNLMKSRRFVDQLKVFYQPKIDIVTGEVVGMEALARWEVEGKLISPNQFIPIAEANGKIGLIDRQIIRRALSDTQKLNRYREKPLKVSVNISGMNLNREFIEFFIEQMHYIGIDPVNIEVEVTENYDINSVNRVIDILEELVECGVSIAIDDFGQGYAALNYLLKFPASTIKIDREFVQNINKPVGDKIIQSIMSLANLLGKKVVAEGVETAAQLEYLAQMKCNEYQGFIYSKPVRLSQFEEMLK